MKTSQFFKTFTVAALSLIIASGCTIQRINKTDPDATLSVNKPIIDDKGYAATDKDGNPLTFTEIESKGGAHESLRDIKVAEQQALAVRHQEEQKTARTESAVKLLQTEWTAVQSTTNTPLKVRSKKSKAEKSIDALFDDGKGN